jgi:hypothetical protein
MITERAIINFLIIGASFILVPIIVSSSLQVDFLPALFFGGLFALAVAFFFLKEQLSLWPMLGGSILGSLNFLPLSLKPSHIFCILLILYYITGYVLIRQKRIKLGNPRFLWPIMTVTLIVLYHNHDLNVRALGGETQEGAKPAILIYLVVLAYFCGINMSSPSVHFFSKIPLYSVILTGLSSVPFLLTTFIPSLAPYAYYITDNVNVQAYLDTQASSSQAVTGISRLGPLGSLGGSLQLYLLSYYPIGTWLRPERWWVAGLSSICIALVLITGFRNSLFSFAVMVMVASWCYYSWRALFLPSAFVIMVLIFFAASSNNLINLPTDKLPLIVQRTLSFLPGDWDEEALESAKSSNDFRQNMQDLYIKEYMDKSPLIGNGFSIDTKEFNRLSDILKNGGGGEDDEYLTARTFIEGKMFHTGWLSVYDAVGIIGSIAFVVLAWNEIRTLAHFMFGPKADRRSSLFPIYVWLLCGILPSMIGFFTVFGDFGQTFSGLCIYAIALSQLSDMENMTEAPMVLPERKGQVKFTGLKGPLYGYQSRP